MYRVGIGGIIHETNTFSQIPAGLDNFIQVDGFYPEMRRGKQIFRFAEGRFNISASGFLYAATDLGMQVVPLMWCGAEPSAPVTEEVFNHLLGILLSDLKSSLPYDGIYLDLHGAMVYGDHQDGETEILRRMREVVGSIPVVVSYDLHGNIAPECFKLATAMVGYRTYPHVDAFETGQRSAQILAHTLNGGALHSAFRQSPFLMPSTTQPTTRDPAKSMYAFLADLERDPGMLSISLMEGFPPCDLPHTGPSIFAYAEEEHLADNAVDTMLKYLLEHEGEFTTDLLPCDQAVSKAIQVAAGSERPVILADIQDNAGGGSPSDTTWILSELVAQKAKNAAIGLIHDPASAQAAHQSGIGTEVELAVGGRALPGHLPFQTRFRVEALHEGPFMGTGPMVKDRELDLGKMARLSVDGVQVLVSTGRMQALDQSLFRVLGIEPCEVGILALKSANHYRADFGPIASYIINVEAPSAIIEDPSKIPYTRLREGVRLKGLGPEFHAKK